MKRFLIGNSWLVFLSMVAGVVIVSSIKHPELSAVDLAWRSIGSVISLYVTVLIFEGFLSTFKGDREEVDYDGEMSMTERIFVIVLIAISVLLWA